MSQGRAVTEKAGLQQAVKAIVSAGPGGPGALIPLAQQVQARLGYVPESAIDAISEKTGVSASEVFGTLTFYAQFRLQPQGRNTIQVCRGTACHVSGGPNILRTLESQLGIRSGSTTPDLDYSLEEIGCFGCCSLAPVMVINEEIHGRLSPEKAWQLVLSLKASPDVGRQGKG